MIFSGLYLVKIFRNQGVFGKYWTYYERILKAEGCWVNYGLNLKDISEVRV